MLQYAVRRNFKFHLLDQTLLRDWFETGRCTQCKSLPRLPRRRQRERSPALQHLDDAKYNARGFMHPLHPQQLGSDHAPVAPHIWHWHGYKPHDVACWMDAIEGGAWPSRAWQDLPVQGSGCRYFDAITMGSCYLRTYAFLLTQHQLLLRFARRLYSQNRNGSHGAGASS